MTSKTRVVLADDHPVVLAGLRTLLQDEEEIEVIGEAMTGLSALSLIREKLPDVAVLDVSMPSLSGIEIAKRVLEQCPTVRTLILSLHEDRAFVNQALRAGAQGYALKRSAAENLPHAIRAVSIGGVYVDPAIAVHLLRHTKQKGGTCTDTQELSEREAEVLRCTALGQTNKEIARQLDLSVKSVETYKARGVEKLGLSTRADIVRYAFIRGWLSDT